MSTAGTVQQIVYDCELIYDLTGHSIIVREMESGALRLHITSVPDNPAGFDIEANEDHYFKISNPTGFDFVPVPDNYEGDESKWKSK